MRAQTYTVLYAFGSGAQDGESPEAGLAIDPKGNLYGTTAFSGIYLGGTLFELDPAGNETILYSFGATPSDGMNPFGVLIADSAANGYGTTLEGGSHGYGTVFELDHNGVETVLHGFAGPPDDGEQPAAGLVRDREGNLYGTTMMGGTYDLGTVFKIDRNGQEAILHSFNLDGTDGATPRGTLALLGNQLYGTTTQGGDLRGCQNLGCGTVFQVDPVTGKEAVLFALNRPKSGAAPASTVTMDAQGNIYITASAGGGFGAGAVLKRDVKNGKLSVFHRFTGPPSDGLQPWGGVIADQAGNLYGTTVVGGSSNQCNPSGCGTVFKIDPSGKETILHNFTNSDGDGALPYAGLVMGAAGNLYGTTSGGGVFGRGIVFKITP